jgi:uncharacterized protein (DUF4415 family)
MAISRQFGSAPIQSIHKPPEPPKQKKKPRVNSSTTLTSIRLNNEVLAKLKEEGPGWQTRVNRILSEALGIPAV